MDNEQLEFSLGEDENPATVEMDNDGENGVVTDKEESPLVETAPAKKTTLSSTGIRSRSASIS